MTKVKVSACIITYNHEAFLRECLDGAINQKGDIEYEIVIGEDKSSDLTKQICIEYAEKHSKLIRFYPRVKNMGMIGNWIETIQNCQGKYIALCEGDDYWTDPLKLQKQVDFLEANPDYVLCFHKINILKTNGEIVEDFITKVPENYESIDTLACLGNYIHTPSVVFRNVITKFPAEFEKSPIGDYYLYMMLAEYGKFKYLEDNMAVYREGVGIWSKENDYFKNFNTAYLHALLCNYFENNISIKLIFTERIKDFLKHFESSITVNELLKLGVNDELKKQVLNILLNKNIDLKKDLLFYKSTKNLFYILLQRLKKKIWN
jgi:glycosyltransferase involved in cell wall biosynthesis